MNCFYLYMFEDVLSTRRQGFILQVLHKKKNHTGAVGASQNKLTMGPSNSNVILSRVTQQEQQVTDGSPAALHAIRQTVKQTCTTHSVTVFTTGDAVNQGHNIQILDDSTRETDPSSQRHSNCWILSNHTDNTTFEVHVVLARRLHPGWQLSRLSLSTNIWCDSVCFFFSFFNTRDASIDWQPIITGWFSLEISE